MYLAYLKHGGVVEFYAEEITFVRDSEGLAKIHWVNLGGKPNLLYLDVDEVVAIVRNTWEDN